MTDIDLSVTLTGYRKINGENTGDEFGKAVGFAGDVNGNYNDDIIIGAPGYNSDTGAAYVIFGSSSLGTLDLSTMSSFPGMMRLRGSGSSGDLFGAAVSRVGNLNNDQYDDVVIGAPGANSLQGIAYIFFGRSSAYDGSVSGYSQKNLLTGNKLSVRFGASLAGVNNFNGNDKPDIVIGGEMVQAYVVFDQSKNSKILGLL